MMHEMTQCQKYDTYEYIIPTYLLASTVSVIFIQSDNIFYPSLGPNIIYSNVINGEFAAVALVQYYVLPTIKIIHTYRPFSTLQT